uniref:Uncharacterized protein MANES_02G126700 n=1 Tax=Rhizophora mucronata TaxID=61149 RepID=A0A2P2IL10_RHIMU
MAVRVFPRSKIRNFSTILLQYITNKNTIKPSVPALNFIALSKPSSASRQYHDGRPRGPLWRGKKLIGKEALFVIMGLKRFKNDEDKLDKFIKTHVLRLLKMELITVLIELERQDEVSLALKVLALRAFFFLIDDKKFLSFSFVTLGS